jgi:hypothetical protein
VQERTFKYKLDFYYQSALIYLITMVLYGGIRGSFVEAKFEYVLNDPLMYVIIIFVVVALVALLINRLRNRRLIITDDAIIFRHRWAEHRIPIADIEWMHIGREALVETGGKHQVVVFKLKNKRRIYRVRIGRYEREKELWSDMGKIAQHVPRRGTRRWGKFRPRRSPGPRPQG